MVPLVSTTPPSALPPHLSPSSGCTDKRVVHYAASHAGSPSARWSGGESLTSPIKGTEDGDGPCAAAGRKGSPSFQPRRHAPHSSLSALPDRLSLGAPFRARACVVVSPPPCGSARAAAACALASMVSPPPAYVATTPLPRLNHQKCPPDPNPLRLHRRSYAECIDGPYVIAPGACGCGGGVAFCAAPRRHGFPTRGRGFGPHVSDGA